MIPFDPRLPIPPNEEYARKLSFQLTQSLREIDQRISLFSAGYMSGIDGRGTAAPTTGTWAVGDVLRNSSPAELGTAGSKYIVFGWQCVTDGTPGTWKELRMLTGG